MRRHTSIRYVAAATHLGAMRIAHDEDIHSAPPKTLKMAVAGLESSPNDIIGQRQRIWRVQLDEVPPPPAEPEFRGIEAVPVRSWWRILVGFIPFAILTGINVVAERAEHYSGKAWDRLSDWMGVEP